MIWSLCKIYKRACVFQIFIYVYIDLFVLGLTFTGCPSMNFQKLALYTSIIILLTAQYLYFVFGGGWAGL